MRLSNEGKIKLWSEIVETQALSFVLEYVLEPLRIWLPIQKGS